jgi:hypothetical protein
MKKLSFLPLRKNLMVWGLRLLVWLWLCLLWLAHLGSKEHQDERDFP